MKLRDIYIFRYAIQVQWLEDIAFDVFSCVLDDLQQVIVQNTSSVSKILLCLQGVLIQLTFINFIVQYDFANTAIFVLLIKISGSIIIPLM